MIVDGEELGKEVLYLHSAAEVHRMIVRAVVLSFVYGFVACLLLWALVASW